MRETSIMNGMNVDRKVDAYKKVYRNQFNDLENNALFRSIREVGPYDLFCLGQQLEMWENYKDMCEADGSIGQLGTIPSIALDLVTATYGASPITALASVQPIAEESGIVYFKNVIADTARGNISPGDKILDSRSAITKYPESYSNDKLFDEVVGTGDGSATQFTVNLKNGPVRPQLVEVTMTPAAGSSAVSQVAKDYEADGILKGTGMYGTVDYETGVLNVEFATAPAAGSNIHVMYQTDFEAAENIPKILTKLESTTVKAEVFALRDTSGMLQSYAMRQRFGRSLDEEIATDLIAAINAEIMGRVARMASRYAMDTVTWKEQPLTGVSDADHRLSFKYKLAECEANILKNSGRGTISAMLGGRHVCSIISTLPGFVKISDGSTLGPHIFGTLDGITVVRITEAHLMDPMTLVLMYRGGSPFDAAIVYAPYMPLVVTSAIPTPNPLVSQKAAAVWSGIKTLVPNFMTKLVVEPA